VHFVGLGIALFVGYALVGERAADMSSQRIAVDSTRIEWLTRNWEARWRRPPTETELRGLVNDHVRQEVLYREALAMGLDSDDEVIRRRMVQKIEFLTEDIAAQAQPSEEQLRAYFQENLDDYRLPERRTFTHIYFNVDRRGDEAVDAAERVLVELRASPSAASLARERGDRFMLQHDYAMQSEADAARAFGQRFAAALFDLEPGDWQGPLPSGYGLHLVRVTNVTEGRAPDLDEVRDIVSRDFATRLREQANAAVLAGLLERYVVDIDEETIRNLSMKRDSLGGGR
jgi:parvulin-like peptidyl-prolyl isomerase